MTTYRIIINADTDGVAAWEREVEADSLFNAVLHGVALYESFRATPITHLVVCCDRAKVEG